MLSQISSVQQDKVLMPKNTKGSTASHHNFSNRYRQHSSLNEDLLEDEGLDRVTFDRI